MCQHSAHLTRKGIGGLQDVLFPTEGEKSAGNETRVVWLASPLAGILKERHHENYDQYSLNMALTKGHSKLISCFSSSKTYVGGCKGHMRAGANITNTRKKTQYVTYE